MKKNLLFALAFLAVALFSCKNETPMSVSIIPQPKQLEVFPGKMEINQKHRHPV